MTAAALLLLPGRGRAAVDGCASGPQSAGLFLAQVVTPNGEPRDIALWRGPQGRLYARRDALRGWTGAPPPAALAHRAGGHDWYPLAGLLPGRWSFDACRQRLTVKPLEAAEPLHHYTLQPRADAPLLPRRLGASLSFNALADIPERGVWQPTGTALLALFGPAGYLDSSWLGSRAGLQRLDSAWRYDWPGRLLRLRLGDAVTQAEGFTTPVRYGGLQFGTDYALQPQFSPYPVAQLSGSAALPSTVQIYQNGRLTDSHDVPVGRFQFSNVPVVTGSGDLQMVVTDAAGRTVSLSQPVYASNDRLRSGLSAWSLETGWLRQDYAVKGMDHYGQALAAAGLRYGVDRWLTVGARLDGTGAVQTLSTSLVRAWPAVGELSLALAGSSAAGTGNGALAGVGLQRNIAPLTFGASVRQAFGDYGDLAYAPGQLRRQSQAFAALRLGTGWSLNTAWSELSLRDRPRLALWVTTLNANLHRLGFLSLSWAHTLGGGDFVGLNFTRSFGALASGSVGVSRDADGRLAGTAAVQHNTRGPLGTSWRLLGQQGDAGGIDAAVQHSSQAGVVSAEASTLGGARDLRLGLASGFVWAGGMPQLSRQPRQSMLDVDVPGVSGVRVYRDHQLVGRTDAEGRLLVPDLIPYQATTISLAPQDLPLDRPIRQISRQIAVAPGASSLRFDLLRGRYRSLFLRLPDGRAVPAGASLREDGVAVSLPVGYDGLVYLDVTRVHRLAASWPGGRCIARLASGPRPEADLRCEPEPAP